MSPAELRVISIIGVPEVRPGDDVGRVLVEAARKQGTALQDGDVLVVTQKIVSKAEGRTVRLSSVEPSALARSIAAQWGKDARHVEVVLRESKRVVRMDRGILICETKHGFVCANAGVDASNVAEADAVTVLPEDPDASAGAIRATVLSLTGVEVAVLVSDSFGRPWRLGTTNVAIGVAGMEPLIDYRGQRDAYGRQLQTSITALADELTSVAEVVARKADSVPATIVRGATYQRGQGSGKALLRDLSEDMFR
ncbi:MAG: coenzyme F420-0:L-glutamate ligase [Dehalococcoidia bacterium]|nr:coenzyme F420-0:L-glutamate ligase [Dehalococcoidia bacterium]